MFKIPPFPDPCGSTLGAVKRNRPRISPLGSVGYAHFDVLGKRLGESHPTVKYEKNERIVKGQERERADCL